MTDRIALKQLTTKAITDAFPGFMHLPEGRPGYWFRRDAKPFLFAFIVVQASQKWSCCEVDVAATFEAMWDKQYGRHHLMQATGLPNLRLNSSAIPMESVPYTFSGGSDGFAVCLNRIISELRSYALPFFDAAESRLNADPLFQVGHNWVQMNLARIPKDFDGMFFSQPGHPPEIEVLEELKSVLRKEACRLNVSKKDRQETGILAIHLMRFASTRLI